MKVHDILERNNREAISLRPEDTIQTASNILVRNKIGAMPVVNADQEVIGILSERDIIRGLFKNGGTCVDLLVQDLMTANVTTCTPGDKVKDVQRIMHNGHFRHLPVINGGKLVGVISQGDVVHICLNMAQTEANVMRDLAIARG